MKLCFIAICLTYMSLLSAAETKIIIVRHAEKELGQDPVLTSAGRERASALGRLLSGQFNVSGIYTSNYIRTIQTATPLAAELNLEMNSSISAFKYQELIDDIILHHSGETVLLVGHTTTIVGLINHVFKRQVIAQISEEDFANLFILRLDSTTPIDLEKYRQQFSENRQNLTLLPFE